MTTFIRKSLTLMVAMGSIALLSQPAWSAEYSLDKVHSTVGFEVSHMMVSTVKGQFHEYDGVIKYDPKKPDATYAEGTVQVSSIDTNNDKRDKHLRSDDFFAVEKYPTIKFKTKKVTKKGDKLMATADLTIKDVTKEVKFPVEIRGPVNNPFADGKQKIGLSAEFTVNRKDFNVNWNKTMEAGGLVVGNDVTIVLEIEADSK